MGPRGDDTAGNGAAAGAGEAGRADATPAPKAAVDADGPQNGLMPVALLHPVVVNGQAVESLQFKRRPKARDRIDAERLAMQKGHLTDQAKEPYLFASLCEVLPEVILELDEVDYGRLLARYMEFMLD